MPTLEETVLIPYPPRWRNEANSKLERRIDYFEQDTLNNIPLKDQVDLATEGS